jgi:hypothetical protein
MSAYDNTINNQLTMPYFNELESVITLTLSNSDVDILLLRAIAIGLF